MEVLVALSMLTVVLIGALVLLDTTNRVTRTQIARADIQQSVRIAQAELARKLRSAGRGGLLVHTPARTLPDGVALEIENNVPANRTLFASDGSSPRVMEGSDILTVRGAFDNPLYYVDPLDRNMYTINPTTGRGSVIISNVTPTGAFVQELDFLRDLQSVGREGEAVVIVSPYDDDVYGVAAADWANSAFNGGNNTFTLAFRFNWDATTFDAMNPTNAIDAASALSTGGAFPRELFTSGFKTISILEEYRFFIRDATVSGTAGGRDAPKLSMVRTQINQDAYWIEDPSDPATEPWEDIADYVMDLQVALGFLGATNEVVESTDGSGDDWHFNHANDILPPLFDDIPELAMIRVTTLARSATPDRGWEAKALLRLEDRSYTDTDVNDPDERRFRRFFLPTVISLRNL